MSLRRTPPVQSPVPERTLSTLNYAATPEHHYSDPQIFKSSENAENSAQTHDYVSQQRHKRTRVESSPPGQFSTLKDEIKEMISTLISAHNRELTSITSELREIKEANCRIDDTMSLLTAQNEDFRKKITLLEQQTKKDQEYISILEDKIEDLQRSSRKASIEIKNVPKRPRETSEDLIKYVTSLSKNIQVDFNHRDINDIFRLRGRNDAEKNPTIIVELRSSLLRTDILRGVKQFNIKQKSPLRAKHLGFTTNEDTPIYIAEQLTPKGARLFFLARDLKRSNKVKYCWTSHGRVLIRRDDTSPIIVIQSESQVQHLISSL